MSKNRTLGTFVSDGNPLANGTIDPEDINGVTASAAELNILDGATVTTAELNILDGATVTTAELNILDGATVTTAELNQIVGSVNLQGFVDEFTLPTTDGTAGQVLSTDGDGNIVFDDASSSVQYPQESKSADYTLVLADAGKQIFHPASDNNVRTFTIPANSSVAFPVGAVVLFTAERGGPNVIVGIDSDTLVTNKNITGNAFVAPGNTLYCVKVKSTEWYGYFLWQSITSFIAVGHTISPFVSAYPWSSSGFGTKFSNPATLPTGAGRGVSFSPAGDAIAVAHDSSPFVSAYPWSSSGFGTKFSNPATLPTAAGRSVAFAIL